MEVTRRELQFAVWSSRLVERSLLHSFLPPTANGELDLDKGLALYCSTSLTQRDAARQLKPSGCCSEWRKNAYA